MSSVNTDRLELGAANVYVKEGATFTFIGGTGAVDVTVQQSWADLKAEQLGDGFANRVLVAVSVFVEFALREISMENFKRAIASGKTFVDDTTATDRRFEITSAIGLDLASIAKELKIVPIVAGVETTDEEKIIVIPKAAPDADTIKWSYSTGTQREIPCRFSALPDTSTTPARYLYTGVAEADDAIAPFGIADV
jgi:hypothetical protein